MFIYINIYHIFKFSEESLWAVIYLRQIYNVKKKYDWLGQWMNIFKMVAALPSAKCK